METALTEGWRQTKPGMHSRLHLNYAHPLADRLGAAYLLQGEGWKNYANNASNYLLTNSNGVSLGYGAPFRAACASFASASSQSLYADTGLFWGVPLSFSAWFKCPSASGGSIACLVTSSSNSDWFRLLSSGAGGKAYLDINGVGGYDAVAGTTTLVLGQWYHIAAVFNWVDNRQLYVNGCLEGNGNGVSIGPTASARFAIGGLLRSSPTGFFDGLIDNVKLWGRALSPQEVYEDYAQPFAVFGKWPPPRPLMPIGATPTLARSFVVMVG